MAASLFTQVSFESASQAGALDGFSSKCSCCGLVLKSSLRTLLEADLAEHAAWHKKKEVK